MRRACCSTSPPGASCTSRSRPASRRTAWSSTATTSRWRSCGLPLTAGVGLLVVDSFDELDRLDALHSEGLSRPAVQLRITPGVEAHTHEFVATGQDGLQVRLRLAERHRRRRGRAGAGSPAVELVGFHAHIGSHVFAVESFARAAELMADFARPYGSRP
jgi:diaminopimelate decarboxylase